VLTYLRFIGERERGERRRLYVLDSCVLWFGGFKLGSGFLESSLDYGYALHK
jgi:hypothetical protein